MASLGPETDPFKAIGFSDDFANLVVNSLKRGRNGEGYGIDVNRSSYPTSSIEPMDGVEIGRAVDMVTGEDAAKQVALVVRDILRRNEER